MVIGKNQTLNDWLRHHAKTRPDALALVDANGALSFGDMAGQVAQLCSGLAGLGIGKGDVVGVQLPNSRDYVIALLAVAARGAVFQTLHMPYRSKELQTLLADSAAKAVIATNAAKDSRVQDVLLQRDTLPSLEAIIVAGPATEGCAGLADLMATTANPDDRIVTTSGDQYLLLYTSGTTSVPKGVPHIYSSFLNNALLSSHEMKISADDRILSLAPMTHLYGLFTLHLSLASGAASVLIPAFNPATLLGDLKSAQASHIFAAPAHFAPLAAQGELTPEYFESTRLLCLSGAPVPPDLAEKLDAQMPRGVVVQLWGMSELQAGTFGRPDDPANKRFCTAGAAVPNTELRILGEDGSPQPAGQSGALQVRGPSVFGGYLNRPDETARAFDSDGWFATGDLAFLDPEGFLTITGRTKEIINRGGIKFNPVEVEEILIALPAIQQCVIVPVPDPDLGERGCLCVQLASNSVLTLKEVASVLADAGIAKFKWPEKLAILDQFPMTPTNKPMRGKLAEIAKNQKDLT